MSIVRFGKVRTVFRGSPGQCVTPRRDLLLPIYSGACASASAAMASSVCLLFSLILVATASAKVSVSVYYESLCPDSRDLFSYEICPNWGKIKDTVDIKLVPFGKASSTSTSFECQHGPKECHGNTVQSCAFSMLQPGTKQVNFACCFMSNPYDDETCVRRAGLAVSEVRKCVNGAEGRELQLIAEVDTKHNTPGPRYVPTVVFNKKYSESDQRKIEARDFMGALCKYDKKAC